MFKRPVLRPPIKVIGYCRFSTFYFQPFLPDRDDTIQLRERQRIKQERIDHTEDRCICADPQRQRDHGNQSEAWFLHQHSSAVAQVLPQFFKPSHATSVAAPFLCLPHPAECLESLASRLLWIPPAFRWRLFDQASRRVNSTAPENRFQVSHSAPSCLFPAAVIL